MRDNRREMTKTQRDLARDRADLDKQEAQLVSDM